MSPVSHPVDRRKVVVGIASAGLAGCGPVERVNRSGAGGLAPPSNGSYLVPIIRELQLDKRYGLDFDINLYTDPGTLYSDLAVGRLTHVFGALFNAANFYLREIPVRLLFTIAAANHAFVSKDPAIRTARDLVGRTVAMPTSSGFYGLALLYLQQNGIDPRRNMNVINAAPAAVGTQLQAGKVDAGFLNEPQLSGMLARGFHQVGDLTADLRLALGLSPAAPVWYIGAYGREEWVRDNPRQVEATLAVWRDAVAFHRDEPERADAMIARFTKIKPEVLGLGRRLGLTAFSVRPAADERANIDAVFRGLQRVDFLRATPDAAFYYDWPRPALAAGGGA
jgi:ABC-type nitrate/sulfonate/bicarbonate transport system substrate-binding protein